MEPYPVQTRIVMEGGRRWLVIDPPLEEAEAEAWRRAWHDYLAAMRSLRYLASKALQQAEESPEQKLQKQNSLNRHLSQLERLEQALVRPILHDLLRSQVDEQL